MILLCFVAKHENFEQLCKGGLFLCAWQHNFFLKQISYRALNLTSAPLICLLAAKWKESCISYLGISGKHA